MKSEYSNVKHLAGRYRRAKLIPVILLPLVAMGVPARSIMGYVGEVEREKESQAEAATRRKRRMEWTALGSVEDQLQILNSQASAFEELIPRWQAEVTVHGAIRKAAVEVGFSLERLNLVEPQAFTEPLNGKVVVERAVTVSGSGDETAGLRMLDILRAQGWPVVLHSMDLVSDSSSTGSFSHAIELGLFHNASADRFALPSRDDGMPITTVEAPIP